MGNAFFLICDKNPKVVKGLAYLYIAFKEIRDPAN